MSTCAARATQQSEIAMIPHLLETDDWEFSEISVVELYPLSGTFRELRPTNPVQRVQPGYYTSPASSRRNPSIHQLPLPNKVATHQHLRGNHGRAFRPREPLNALCRHLGRPRMMEA
jgi:hypothetical protein